MTYLIFFLFGCAVGAFIEASFGARVNAFTVSLLQKFTSIVSK